MPNYQNGKIYKLVNDVDNDIYVGSTTTSLSMRKSKHVNSAKTRSDRCVYEHLNEIGWDNVKIILIENFPCDSREELVARERYWFEQLQPTLNIQCPGRNKKEWNIAYYEKIKQRQALKALCVVCNKLVTKVYMNNHNQTSKHIQNLCRDPLNFVRDLFN